VICTKNHDQVGNRPLGDRPATYLSAAQQRLWVTFMLVSPFVPLIFMGEEYAESRPFPFFCSFENPQLIEAVQTGRRREFEELQFRWETEFPDPNAESTFEAAVLSWSWPPDSRCAGVRTLYRDLLHARRKRRGLRDREFTHAALLSTVPGRDAADIPILRLERGREPALLIIANLSDQSVPLPPDVAARGDLLFSSEAVPYGGTRVIGSRHLEQILPHEALMFGPGGPIA
jgi:maltooligosyltrehalose trehalohydrolase